MKKFVEKDVAENPLYHDTWKLLKKSRVICGLIRFVFQMER